MSSEVMRYRLEHNTPAREVQPGRDINILRGTVMVTEADHGRTIDALLAERDVLKKALAGLLALDEEDHQRYPGDEDVCAEVRDARAALQGAQP